MRILMTRFGTAAAIFRTAPHILGKIRGIGNIRVKAISEFKDFQAAEKEQAFLEKYKIRSLFFTDPDYPRRLADSCHAPALLFYKGTADLNAAKIIAVVGTRSPTEYGRQTVEKFIEGLSVPGLLIVSGLAYGIDVASHKAALKNHLPTIGVLGHGLDQIYPPQHAALAREMTKQGGLLTQFNAGTSPEDYNFPVRNQIVARMSDAIVVIETDRRGGSMLSAENAWRYGKKLFAFPGRITDPKSAGCNALIRQGKARLLTDPQQLIQEMGWDRQPGTKPGAKRAPAQAALFQAQGTRSGDAGPAVAPAGQPARSTGFGTPTAAALTTDEKALLNSIRQRGSLSHDELLVAHGLGHGAMALALLNLELKGLIKSLPGRMYRLPV
ncbi:MAG TPA: DNA-processing protein DprA [Puia sp.]|nr:DNA-processing protein DprA [Puia sp.]